MPSEHGFSDGMALGLCSRLRFGFPCCFCLCFGYGIFVNGGLCRAGFGTFDQFVDVDVIFRTFGRCCTGLPCADFHIEVARVAVFVDGGFVQTVGQIEQTFARTDGGSGSRAPASGRGMENDILGRINRGNARAERVADGGRRKTGNTK